MYFITHSSKLPVLPQKEHIECVGIFNNTRGSILPLPTFLNPANNPAPTPIVPHVPKAEVILSTTFNKELRALIPEIIPSELATLLTTDVHVFESLFKEPSQEFAVFSASAAIDPVPAEYSSSILEYIS